jgi:hypothetical protein
VRHACNSLSPWPIKGRRTPPPQGTRDNHRRHTTHSLSNSPTTSSATSPGTWRPRLLSHLACRNPTTGTPVLSNIVPRAHLCWTYGPPAGTRINLVLLIAWRRPLRDRPRRLLLVSVGTTFRTDSWRPAWGKRVPKVNPPSTPSMVIRTEYRGTHYSMGSSDPSPPGLKSGSGARTFRPRGTAT